MRYFLSPLAVMPVELVEKIFYDLDREAAKDHMALNPLSDSYNPPFARTLFPYNVASVCQRWKATAYRTPSFWKRLNISVTSATQLNIKQHLLLSDTLDISVIIHNAAGPGNNPEERSAVSAILRILQPHLHRCCELQIVVNHGSSLPLFSSLHGVSAKLQILVLRCLIDDGSPVVPEGVRGTIQVAPQPYIEPLFIYLSGYTILDTLQHHVNALQGPGTRVIALDNFDGSRYAPVVAESLLPGLIDVLSAPRTLEPDSDDSENGMESSEATYGWSPMYQLSNFRLSVGGPTQPLHELSEGVMLSLHAFDEGALRMITQNLDLEDAHVEIWDSEVSNISLLGHPLSFRATRLTGDLKGILNEWECGKLVIVDCDDVDDETLSLLGPSRHSGFWQDLYSLKIANCPNISVQGIRDLVNDRTGCDEITGQPYVDLHELVVEHAEPLNGETSEWFATRVGTLRWYTEQMDEDDVCDYWREW